ncbi:MAG TPA: insulinase family protein [Anaerolineae bacterium]|nr:insulinase family protein [Anaerolineae bacterium]
MQNNYTSEKLPNGLTFMLKEIHTVPIISQWVWYRVGSRDEPPGQTGLSHWVEHMQFKGTQKFPIQELDHAISREGGIWNAMTYLDWTTYFETMPAYKIDIALELEADRMVNSLFDEKEIESERNVIISEREGNENEPLFHLNTAVQKAAFEHHPYKHEVIGVLEDIKNITRENLYDHYHSYYTPNNAIIALAGDFNRHDILKKLEDLYKEIPPGNEPARFGDAEPLPKKEKRIEVEGPGDMTYLQISYRAPKAYDSDFFALTVLDSLLSGPSSLNMFGGGSISNKTSRLYQSLVEKDLAVSVSGGLQATIDPFQYTFLITIHPVSFPEKNLAAFDNQINKLCVEPVNPAEIKRSIKQAKAMFAYGSENITNQAFWLGYANMFADYDWYLDYIKKLESITDQDVQYVAQKYLNPERRVLGIFKPTQQRS